MPIVTLLTDFGLSDSYVAELRGVILSAAPSATLVDITHAIPPGDIRAAAFVLGRAWQRFPAGTVHLAVVDPGVGTPRAALALRARSQFLVGPDNGIFTHVLRDTPVEIVTLPVPAHAAPTFHGRDLFAPAAAALATGVQLETLGPRFPDLPERLATAEPRYEGKSVIGEVVYVDRFGTLVTNLTAEQAPAYATVEVEDLDIGPLRRTFADVAAGGLLAYLGSDGALEIAVRNGSAARRLGLGVGGQVRVRLDGGKR
jgi:S-adenosyl-L-methionine hydrolase (adenosine-forming)